MDFGDYGSYNSDWFGGIDYNTPFWDTSLGGDLTGIGGFDANSLFPNDMYLPNVNTPLLTDWGVAQTLNQGNVLPGGGSSAVNQTYDPNIGGSGDSGLLGTLGTLAKLALGFGGIGAKAAAAGQGSTGSKDIVSSPGNTLAYNYAKNYKPEGKYSISPYLLDQGGDIAGQMMQQAMGTTPEQQFLRNMLFKSSTITPHALGYDPREEEMINLTRQYYAQLGEDIDRDKFATGTGRRGIDEQQYLDAVAAQKSEELKAIMQAIAQERELKKYYDTLAQAERNKAPSSMLDMLAKQQAAVAPWKTAGVGTEESNAQLQAIRDALMLKLITATQGTGTQTTLKGEREGTGTDVLSTILASMLVPEKNAATGETAPSGYNLLFGENGILGLLGLA